MILGFQFKSSRQYYDPRQLQISKLVSHCIVLGQSGCSLVCGAQYCTYLSGYSAVPLSPVHTPCADTSQAYILIISPLEISALNVYVSIIMIVRRRLLSDQEVFRHGAVRMVKITMQSTLRLPAHAPLRGFRIQKHCSYMLTLNVTFTCYRILVSIWCKMKC